MKVAKVKAQLKTIGIADLKQICYATRVTMLGVLFEPRYVRRCRSN